MAEITIYHNPDCGTSRNTLALILGKPDFSTLRAMKILARRVISSNVEKSAKH